MVIHKNCIMRNPNFGILNDLCGRLFVGARFHYYKNIEHLPNFEVINLMLPINYENQLTVLFHANSHIVRYIMWALNMFLQRSKQVLNNENCSALQNTCK